MKRRRESGTAELAQAQVVYEVQAGLKTVREAARELGISTKHYYRVEEKVCRAVAQALTPRARGRPPKPEADARLAGLETELRKSRRERELLELRVKDLEELDGTLRRGILTNAGEKKARTRAPRAHRLRKPIPDGVQTAPAGLRGGPAQGGQERRGDVPEGRYIQGELLPLEEKGGAGAGKDRPEATGSRGAGGMPGGRGGAVPRESPVDGNGGRLPEIPGRGPKAVDR